MGKYKAYIIFAIAVILALITSVLVSEYLRRKTTVKDISMETQPIVVAKVDLAWGTTINKEMIELRPYLKTSLPPGYFSETHSVVGRVLIHNIKANEPVLESRLAPTTIKTGGVAAVVTPKKRAVSVKVDKVVGVSGFIHPGNRVDVLVTIQPEGTKSPITKIVLENILVLASGPEIQLKGKEEKPSQVDVITLEVTPEEAEKLALAATEGKILLALRNFTDTEEAMTRGVTVPVLLASYSGYPLPREAKPVTRKTSVAKKPTPEKIPVPTEDKKVEEKKVEEKKAESEKGFVEKKPPYVVELIKGTKLTEVKFERSE